MMYQIEIFKILVVFQQACILDCTIQNVQYLFFSSYLWAKVHRILHTLMINMTIKTEQTPGRAMEPLSNDKAPKFLRSLLSKLTLILRCNITYIYLME